MPPVTPATAKAKHASDVVLTGVSWNLTTPTDATTGVRSGRIQSAFGIKKQLDQFTPALAAAEVSNGVEKAATVYVTPTNTRDNELLIYTLTNVIITSDHQSATTTGSTEALTMSFQKLELSYLRAGKVVTSVSFDGISPVT
jgi:type VI protein secretion system component Hcp